MTSRDRLDHMNTLIENQTGEGTEGREIPFRLADMHAIATDARPVPTLTPPWTTDEHGWTNIPPDADQVAESAYIASLYAGVPFGEGQRKEQLFRERKAEAAALQRATKGGRRV